MAAGSGVGRPASPLPGASAEEVERLVTNPLEDAIDAGADLRWVVSNSRENVSSILVRFSEIPDKVFDKRMNDLRREVLNQASAELPLEGKLALFLQLTDAGDYDTSGQMNDSGPDNAPNSGLDQQGQPRKRRRRRRRRGPGGGQGGPSGQSGPSAGPNPGV